MLTARQSKVHKADAIQPPMQDGQPDAGPAASSSSQHEQPAAKVSALDGGLTCGPFQELERDVVADHLHPVPLKQPAAPGWREGQQSEEQAGLCKRGSCDMLWLGCNQRAACLHASPGNMLPASQKLSSLTPTNLAAGRQSGSRHSPAAAAAAATAPAAAVAAAAAPVGLRQLAAALLDGKLVLETAAAAALHRDAQQHGVGGLAERGSGGRQEGRMAG